MCKCWVYGKGKWGTFKYAINVLDVSEKTVTFNIIDREEGHDCEENLMYESYCYIAGQDESKSVKISVTNVEDPVEAAIASWDFTINEICNRE